MELTVELARRLLKIQGLESDFGIVRIEQQSDDGSVGNELKQELQLLRCEVAAKPADAGNVRARFVQAGDKAGLDWIAAEGEHDRDRWRCGLGSVNRGSAAGGDDHAGPSLDQIGRQPWQPNVLAPCPPRLNDRILAFDNTRFLQSLSQSSETRRKRLRRTATKEPDHRHCRLLLRARGEWPRGGRAREQRDELAPPLVEHGAFFPRWAP